jgi:hypothetical protein
MPYTFGTATAAIPLSQLDTNFATPITLGNTSVYLNNTYSSIGNLTLANVTITSGTVTITNVSVTTANVSGTANISTLVVVGNETVGGNTTITGNITAANANVTTNLVLSGGTANGVAYLNTSKQVTTGSVLTFDGTNLGVGSTSLSSSAGRTDVTINGASTGAIISFGNGGVRKGYLYQDGTDLTIANEVAGNFRFLNNGSEAMRIASATGGVGAVGIGYTSLTSVGDNGLAVLGNVGIGTSSPSEKLHVVGKIAVSGTNPSIRQTVQNAYLDLCGGTTVGTDPAIQIAGSTTTSDANKIFYNANAHVFRTSSGGSTYATIDTSGNLLVGKTATSDSTVGFQVSSGGRVSCGMASGDAYIMYSTTASAYRFYVTNAGTINATNTTITAISDQRLKENIRDLDDGLATVMALKPRKFDWKTGKGKDIKNDRGFIAQEFETVFPDMVEEWKDPAPEGEEPYKAVNANLIPTLVKAIQELKAEFDAYKASHP